MLSFARLLSAEAQAELLESLSIENYLIDNLVEAIQARQQASLIWERLENDVRAGDCKRWLSRLHWGAGNKKEAEKYADQAIDILLKQPPGLELAMAFSNKSQLHMLADEEKPALEWGRRAIELAEKLGDVEILVHAMTNVGWQKPPGSGGWECENRARTADRPSKGNARSCRTLLFEPVFKLHSLPPV